MKITNEFTVHTPIERAWAVLTDLQGIAPCMPGAQLTGVDGDTYKGKSGWLVPDWAPFQYAGQREGNGARLTVTYGGTKNIGELRVRNERGTLKGSGTLHDIPVTITGKRPRERPAGSLRVHDFAPQVFYRRIDGTIPPDEIQELIDVSYELIVAKLPKSKRPA